MVKKAGLTLGFLLAGLVPGIALASTVPGEVMLAPTFENISVRAKYAGDANQDNSAVIRWRRAGDPAWLDAHPPVIDRRTDIDGADNTEHAFEARVSIVGLEPDTEYEVEVTWDDPDEITGAQPPVTAVRTLSPVPPTGGGVIWVDDDAAAGGDGTEARPYRQIPDGLDQATAGDTIRMKAGSYQPFTLGISGSQDAWIVVEGEEGARIGSPASGSQIRVEGDYLAVRSLTFAPTADGSSEYAAVEIRGQHHVFVQDCTVEDISPQNSHYGDAGVLIRPGSRNIYVLHNRFHTSNPTVYPDNGVYGVYFRGTRQPPEGGFVIADNQIEGVGGGHFRDGIGGESNSSLGAGPYENSDIARNLLRDCSDDGLEIEGGNINVRVWGNHLVDVKMAIAPTVVGPSYVYRNIIEGDAAGSAFKLGNGSLGYAFLYHNTIVVSTEGLGDHGGSPKSENMVVVNNILSIDRQPGYTYYHQGRSNRYDHNLLHNQGGTFVRGWEPGGLDFDDLTAFQQATGQEQNGHFGDPALLAATLVPEEGSPAIDRGVVLPTFNDAASAWPYAGSGPDLGAFERDADPDQLPPASPENLQVE